MKKPSRQTKLRMIAGASLVGIIILLATINIVQNREKRLARRQNRATPEMVRYAGANVNYSAEFRDLQDKHIDAARRWGLKQAPENREAVKSMKGRLTMIETCDDYKVMDLANSVPYLRPYAARELQRIGRAFRDSLEAKGLPKYRVIVTSVLRTQEDVKALRHSNVNATTNSAHEFGTTFDIWYANYDWREYRREMDQSDLRRVLAEVLRSEREAGRIWVKYENKQHCFHITCKK